METSRWIASSHLKQLLDTEKCKSCNADLSMSAIAQILSGACIAQRLLYPVLCLCGQITVIGIPNKDEEDRILQSLKPHKSRKHCPNCGHRIAR